MRVLHPAPQDCPGGRQRLGVGSGGGPGPGVRGQGPGEGLGPTGWPWRWAGAGREPGPHRTALEMGRVRGRTWAPRDGPGGGHWLANGPGPFAAAMCGPASHGSPAAVPPGAVRLPPHSCCCPPRLPAGPAAPDPAPGLLHRLLSAGERGGLASVGWGARGQGARRWGAHGAGRLLSPPQAHPSRLQILVAVVQYQTRLREPRRGLCSSWLASLDPAQGDPGSLGWGLGPGPASLFKLPPSRHRTCPGAPVGAVWGPDIPKDARCTCDHGGARHRRSPLPSSHPGASGPGRDR